MTKNRYRTLRACPQASIVSTLTKHLTYSGYDLSYVSPNIVVDRAAKLPNTDSRVGSSHSLALAISDGEYLNSLPRGRFSNEVSK